MRLFQYKVVYAREQASFWRENVTTVVILLRVLARISFWREQVIKWQLRFLSFCDWERAYRAHFPGVEKVQWSIRGCLFSGRIEIKNLSMTSGMISLPRRRFSMNTRTFKGCNLSSCFYYFHAGVLIPKVIFQHKKRRWLKHPVNFRSMNDWKKTVWMNNLLTPLN